MKYLIGAGTLLILLIVVGLIMVYSGAYNISAMVPHNKLTLWMINTLMDNSVEHNADNSIKTPGLSDTALVKTGFVHFRKMCVVCHGAPGVERSEIGQGLYPKAPHLSGAAKDWTPQQLFWIIKNGIKMTGMPAFAPTHPDSAIWAIVAFTNKLPTLTKEQYKTLDNETKGQENEQKK